MSKDLGQVVGRGISTITSNGSTVTVKYTDTTTSTFTINGAWTSNTLASGYTLYVNTLIRMCCLHCELGSRGYTELVNSVTSLSIPSAYKPLHEINCSTNFPQINLRLTAAGVLTAYSTLTTKNDVNVFGDFWWHY